MSAIEEGIKGCHIKNAIENTWKCIHKFKNKKGEVLNIIKIAQERKSPYFDNLLDQIENLEVKTEDEIVARDRPVEMVTEDPIAKQQRFRTPPHIQVEAKAHWSTGAVGAVVALCRLVEQTIDQMERVHATIAAPQITGTKIFIGHGHSLVWLELEKYLKVRLKQDVDEFNRVSTAGRTTIDRLSEMLNHAKFAFLILTGEDEIKPLEDEKADPRLQARMNVIHEAGLFQGRLGFLKAIVLLELGCEEFSNIHGLGQIRFPKGDLSAKFEEIRRLLEDRDIIAK